MVRLNKFLSKAKDAAAAYQNAEEPQQGLVPIGNSPFYMTPSEPADPLDCDRYPDSIFCGNPINSSPVELGVDLVRDECTFGIQLSPTIGFIKLPPFQIVYRNPACTPTPPSPPVNESGSPYVPPQTASGIYIFINSGTFIFEEVFNNGVDKRYREYTWTSRLVSAKYPKAKNSSFGQVVMEHLFFLKNDFSWETGDEDGSNGGGIYTVDFYNSNGFNDFFVTEGLIIGMACFGYQNALLYAANSGKNVKIEQRTQRNATDYQYTKKQYVWTVYEVDAKSQTIDPPPPPKKECCKMACCPNNSNLEQLLRLVLKKIGSSNLPANVPVSLAKPNSGTKSIGSLAEYIAYSVKQMDALVGKYPLEIKIEDADLTQEGNQSKIINLPNMAEAIAEILGLLLIIRSESDATLIATVNGMIEAGSAKQAATLAVDYAKANAEYLGYKGKQVEHKLPFTFKPGEQRLDKMLKSGEVSVKGFENDDQEDLNDHLAPLLEMAAMYRAANFKNLGTNTTYTNLKNALKGAAKLSKEIDGLVNPPQDPNNPTSSQPKKSDWDTFLESAEQGFIAQPGITDSTNPYSRPLDQRPKIREIGNDTSETPPSGQ